MNIERLTIIAEWLEAGAPARDGVTGFDMTEVGECGTACCIIGTAIQFFGCSERDAGVDVLGLTTRLGDELYMPPGWLGLGACDRVDYTAAWAARTIRHLIATGVVDWNATKDPA